MGGYLPTYLAALTSTMGADQAQMSTCTVIDQVPSLSTFLVPADAMPDHLDVCLLLHVPRQKLLQTIDL